MRSLPDSRPFLATAHFTLAVVAMLFAGWLQSALSPKPWWHADMTQLGDLSLGVQWLRFAGLAYLLVTTLCEWRFAVALRRRLSVRLFIGRPALTAHALLLAGVALVVARGTQSRALYADLDEWLAATGVCALLALTLGLFTSRAVRRDAVDIDAPVDVEPGETPSTISQRLVWALAIVSGLTLMACVVLETRPLPHLTKVGP